MPNAYMYTNDVIPTIVMSQVEPIDADQLIGLPRTFSAMETEMRDW